MPFLIQNFWCKIFSSSTKRIGLLSLGLQEFRQAKICKIDIPCFVDQNILRFKISVHDAVVMKIPKCNSYLSSIEFDNMLRESLVMKEMII
jgi:hypothetical protein